MSDKVGRSLEEAFGEIADPGAEGRCEHKLIEVIIGAVCAAITGEESWVEVKTFGKLKEAWLKQFLELPGGIPSQDTFGRIFAALNA